MSDGIGVASAVAWPSAQPYQEAPDDGKPHIWAQKGFRFHDLLDIVNPLQHIPVISSIYRWITGEPIGNLPRVVGDALFGGPIGFATGLLGVGIKEETGKDLGENVIAMLTGEHAEPSANTADTALEPAIAPAQEPAQAEAPLAAESAATPRAIDAPPLPIAAASPPPARPDHAPIPLVRGAVSPPTASASLSSDAARAFLAQAAERQRQIYQGKPVSPGGRTLNSQRVPLDLPPGLLAPANRPHPVRAAAPADTTATSAAAAQTVPPADLPQRMMEALDKYAAMQRQKNGSGGDGDRGAQVDVIP